MVFTHDSVNMTLWMSLCGLRSHCLNFCRLVVAVNKVDDEQHDENDQQRDANHQTKD